MNTLRKYRNKLFVDFDVRGENFTINVPHKPHWNGIQKFLKKRGFKVTAIPRYVEHYNTLSQYHRIGKKGEVACILELNAGSIHLDFGHIKNLWNCEGHFWDMKGDDRVKPLTYLEQKAVIIEQMRMMEYCKSFTSSFDDSDDDALTPEQYIIKKLRINTHVHGKVNCLDDIKKDIENRINDYFNSHNVKDRDGNKITCGDTMYFYDYNGRLSCGKAWHNINNMWWVISGGHLRNIACFNLFRSPEGMPRRQGNISRAIKKMESALEKAKNANNFKECERIYSALSCIVAKHKQAA